MGEKQTYSQSEQKRRERRLLLALSFGTLAAAGISGHCVQPFSAGSDCDCKYIF